MPSRESAGSQPRPELRGSSLRRRDVLAGAASVGALGTAGCLNVLDSSGDSNGSNSSVWPTYRGDWQRTGLAPADAGPGESLSVAWETSYLDVIEAREGISARHAGATEEPIATGTCGNVTLSDDLVYCTTNYRIFRDDEDDTWGGVVAMDAESGSIEWTIGGLSAMYQAPTVVGDRLYQFVEYQQATDVNGSHVLVADAASGEVEARHSVPGTRRDAPTITPDAIYHRATEDGEGTVVSIDPESGERNWIADVPRPQPRLHPFTIADGSPVYGAELGDGRRSLLALDPDTGDERWRLPFDVPQREPTLAQTILGAPSIVDGNVYVAGRWDDHSSDVLFGSALRSFGLEGRDERWTFRPEGVPYEDLMAEYDAPGCRSDATDCERPDSLAALRGTPLVVDDLVVVPGYGQPAPNGESNPRHRYLYAVSAADGSLQWSLPVTAASAVAAGDVIYARIVNDGLAAISPDGTVLDTVDARLGPSWGQPPSIGHGRVYTTWGAYGGHTPKTPDTVVAIE